MQYNQADDIFKAFEKLKVLIVGDVMVDAYVWGKVERISPEAPVPVVQVRKRERRLGGAANVALNIQALGATPLLCAVVGKDEEGRQFRDMLRRQHISDAFITESSSRITTVKERIMAGSQQMLRVDAEDDRLLNEAESLALMHTIEEATTQADVIIFQDYDKGMLNEERIQRTVALAMQKNIPTAVDPKRRNFLYYQNTTLFKPNLKELLEGLKILAETEKSLHETVAEASTQVKQRLQAASVLVTLSEHGVYMDAPDGRHLTPAHVRQIADVSGAGDTVISIAALCLALRLPSRRLAGLSNLGGGIVCEHAGVVPIDKATLLGEASKYLFAPV